MKRIGVFCGSSPGTLPDYARAAQQLAGALVARSLGLVYGGAKVGLMGEIARAVKALGGEVIGVIPRTLVEMEVAFRELDDLRMVESMHERKAVIGDLSDGFVAMPGGFGTLDELFEVLTWAQLGIQRKPCGLLNIAGYWNELLAFLDHAVDQRFIKGAHRSLLLVADDPERLLESFESYRPAAGSKWLDRQVR